MPYIQQPTELEQRKLKLILHLIFAIFFNQFLISMNSINLKKHNYPIPRKCLDRQTDRQIEGQTLLYKTLPAKVRGPKKVFSKVFLFFMLCTCKPYILQKCHMHTDKLLSS